MILKERINGGNCIKKGKLNSTRIQLLSDTHSKKFSIDESVDFAIHAGDITNLGKRQGKAGLDWDNSIRSFEKSKRPIYWIPGNHDIGFRYNTKIKGGINVLEKKVMHNNISIIGISMSVCYNAPYIAENWDHMTAVKSEESKYFSVFLKEYADIIVSHCPPSGDIGSEIQCGDIGSECLLDYIERFQPKLVVCGHVHWPLIREVQIGKTKVINVATTSKIIDYESYTN